MAGGVAVTGAGTLDAGMLATGLRVGGVALLVATAILAAVATPTPASGIAMTRGGLAVLLWAAGALALVSWLLAFGSVIVALILSVRIEPGR
jgi:hypothetical protein